MKPQSPYGKNSVWTVTARRDKNEGIESAAEPAKDLGQNGYVQNEYDLCLIEVEDDGKFKSHDQLDRCLARIKEARQIANNGIVVVFFVHGWHNNADWDNANLNSFRGLLQSLMLREMEQHGRRVIGIYLGWNGDPAGKVGKWLAKIPMLKQSSFYDRYGVAGTIGNGDALTNSVRDITHATKGPLNGVSHVSPLVFAGHSMGAFILQSSLLALIENGDLDLPSDQIIDQSATVFKGDVAVHMPDLILSLNSAAESAVAEQLIKMFERGEWRKEVMTGMIQYNPPIMMSVTSEADRATSWIWETAKKGTTDGHNAALATHKFVEIDDVLPCAPIPGLPNFGQPWHCIRGPQPSVTESPSFVLKLPTMWPKNGVYEHRAYELRAKDKSEAHLFWIFQVPKGVIKDHGDIFNYQAASLTLALIQLSGALVSVARDWENTFG